MWSNFKATISLKEGYHKIYVATAVVPFTHAAILMDQTKVFCFGLLSLNGIPGSLNSITEKKHTEDKINHVR